MSASRRHAQTFGSCSLFVFQKHFSPFTSSPPLPHADISPPLLTSSLFQTLIFFTNVAAAYTLFFPNPFSANSHQTKRQISSPPNKAHPSALFLELWSPAPATGLPFSGQQHPPKPFSTLYQTPYSQIGDGGSPRRWWRRVVRAGKRVQRWRERRTAAVEPSAATVTVLPASKPPCTVVEMVGSSTGSNRDVERDVWLCCEV
ncbi:hypothetical protein HanIR_Chr03g0135501 [Helianthus annuus]|nr:hypothetical protein HanIR_Chr03g0135501 [Helianthus annuus]